MRNIVFFEYVEGGCWVSEAKFLLDDDYQLWYIYHDRYGWCIRNSKEYGALKMCSPESWSNWQICNAY